MITHILSPFVFETFYHKNVKMTVISQPQWVYIFVVLAGSGEIKTGLLLSKQKNRPPAFNVIIVGMEIHTPM